MADNPVPLIQIDQADAVELIEILEFVEAWLAQAGPAVTADLEHFVERRWDLTSAVIPSGLTDPSRHLPLAILSTIAAGTSETIYSRLCN
jgi:hypothetical protein